MCLGFTPILPVRLSDAFINLGVICAINDRNRGFCQLKGGKENMYEMLPEAVPDSLRTSPETPVLGLEEGSAWVDVIPEGVLGSYGGGGREFPRW
jgi:hypothetical protein